MKSMVFRPAGFTVLTLLLLNTSCFSQVRLSSTPTLSEIKKAFVGLHSTKNDAFTSLSTIIQRKDAAVPALRDYINAFSLKDEESGEEPNRLYGVLALEGIGTEAAFSVLFQTALLHPENETKGKSLQVFATSYHGKVVNDSLVPNKEVIHLFLRNCDDTTYVEFCHKRMGNIARDGIKLWTGLDFGGLPLERKIIKVWETNSDMTMEQYHEWWWDQNQSKLIWSEKEKKFALSPN